ncbi:hypothetical protein Hanom_Chr12g01104431 [Helianthus anomalus]
MSSQWFKRKEVWHLKEAWQLAKRLKSLYQLAFFEKLSTSHGLLILLWFENLTTLGECV